MSAFWRKPRLRLAFKLQTKGAKTNIDSHGVLGEKVRKLGMWSHRNNIDIDNKWPSRRMRMLKFE